MASALPAPPLPPVLAVAILTVTALLHARLGLSATGFLTTGAMSDTDSWTRLIRVFELWQGAGWFDETTPMLNAPQGLSLHWPRLFDLLILGPAVALNVAGLEPRDSVRIAGAVLCPVLHALAALATARAGRWMWPGIGPSVAALLVVSNPVAVGYSVLGRADHHIAVVLFGMLALADAMPAMTGDAARAATVRAGIWAGIAVWISPEGLLFAAPILAAFGLVWATAELWRADPRRVAARGRGISMAFASTCLAGIVLEHPPSRWLAAEYDKISAQHALMGLLATVVFAGAGRVGGGMVRRTASGAAMAGAALGVLLLLRPQVFAASLAGADEVAARLFLPGVVEMQPFRRDPAGLAADLLTFFPALLLAPAAIALGWRGWRDAGRLAVVVPPALCALASAAAAVQHRRFAIDLAGPASLLAAGVPVLLLRRHGPRPARALAALASTLAVPLLPMAAPVLAPSPETAATRRCGGAEAVATLKHALPEAGPRGAAAPIVFADTINVGPEVAWRTGLRMVGSPYHRGGAAFADTVALFAATDDDTARSVLARRQASFLLRCEPVASVPEGALTRRLARAEVPDWLEPLGVARETGFALFRVR